METGLVCVQITFSKLMKSIVNVFLDTQKRYNQTGFKMLSEKKKKTKRKKVESLCGWGVGLARFRG